MGKLAFFIACSVIFSALAVASTLDDAHALQAKGKLKEARDLYRTAAAEFRARGDRQNLATALSGAGKISVSLGDYKIAITDAREAADLRTASKNNVGLGTDFTTLGLANYYLGNFSLALENYQTALISDRAEKDAAGEIWILNNIGNIYYFQGYYSLASEYYAQALMEVNATQGESWNPWGRQLTITNTAVLYQQLGLEEKALQLYKQIANGPQAMPANEYAQLLVNEGALYRRLGDPIKALELYRTAQGLYRTDHDPDGEISVLRNIGRARAVDLDDLSGALSAFTEARKLSEESSNSRGFVQASLFLGEVLRRLKRMSEAKANLSAALDGAQKDGLVDEQWRALHGLGRISEDMGQTNQALDQYRKAIGIIEAVRANLQTSSLGSGFLVDKRDVYDALISLYVRRANPSFGEIFHWMERSRARTLSDRMATQSPQRELSLEEVQAHLDSETVFVEFWIDRQRGAAIWATSAAAGMVRYDSAEQVQKSVNRLLTAVQWPSNGWKENSRELGNQILAGIPLRRHLILVPDGILNIPFETLTVPGSQNLVIEKSDVTYLPSARFMNSHGTSSWAFPWSREIVAFGDPPVSSSDSLAETETWQRLSASSGEIHEIARMLPGRAEIHLGKDARKSYLLNHSVEGAPLLHLSTHALVDAENPDRSRILMASDSSTSDYVFQDEVYGLDLKDVGLVTLSACDTARGKMVRGEGVQAFSQAFLAAGASATVTSLWKVDDEAAASLMPQFYYFLGRQDSKAEALREAKLYFLRSNSKLSSPRYWAAFVLNGDGWNRSTRVAPWSVLLMVAAVIVLAAGLALRIAATAAKKAA